MLKQSSGITQHICIALLTLIFVVCALATLLFGAQIYETVSSNIDRQYGVHTAVEYIATRLHYYDTQGNIDITEHDGTSVLMLYESSDEGESYVTYLYCYNGSLCELYCSAESELDMASGTEILALDSMELSTAGNGLVDVNCALDGDSAELRLFVQSKSGGDAA